MPQTPDETISFNDDCSSEYIIRVHMHLHGVKQAVGIEATPCDKMREKIDLLSVHVFQSRGPHLFNSRHGTLLRMMVPQGEGQIHTAGHMERVT